MGSGAQPPEHSTSIVTGPSTSGLTWRITATTTPQPLVGAWAASTAYTVGQVVKSKGRYYRCESAGTSGTAAPSGLGEIEDDSVTWKGVSAFVGGLKIANIAAGGGATVYWDFGDVDDATGDAILAGGAFVTLSVADPSLIYVATASGTAELSIAGLC